MANRSRLAAERISVSVVRVEKQVARRLTFCALEGPMPVLIEADSEEEAYAICAAEGLEFVCLCDDN